MRLRSIHSPEIHYFGDLSSGNVHQRKRVHSFSRPIVRTVSGMQTSSEGSPSTARSPKDSWVVAISQNISATVLPDIDILQALQDMDLRRCIYFHAVRLGPLQFILCQKYCISCMMMYMVYVCKLVSCGCRMRRTRDVGAPLLLLQDIRARRLNF
ncbi:unnamed protein product [Victoria cruziana]